MSEVNGCDIGTAIRWLEAQGFRTRQILTRAEIAKAKQVAVAKARRAENLQLFRHAFDRALDRWKLEAGERNDMAALERAATQQYRLHCDPFAEFDAMERSNGTELLRLIEEGREDRQDAAIATAAIVEMLMAAQSQKGAYDRAA